MAKYFFTKNLLMTFQIFTNIPITFGRKIKQTNIMKN